MEQVKKTPKYYRDILANADKNFSLALSVMGDVLKKYGNHPYSNYEIPADVEFNWNHQVKGFTLTKKGVVYVDVYWQGDSTDGDDCCTLADFRWNNVVVIKAEYYEPDRYGVREERHSPLRVERAEVISAMKWIAENWLNPKDIKVRKEKETKEKKMRALTDYVRDNLIKPKTTNNWGECTDNARYAVFEFLRTYADAIYKMDKTKVLELAKEVWSNNYRSNWSTPRDKDGKRIYKFPEVG